VKGKSEGGECENEVRWPQVAIFLLAYLTGAHLAETALSEHPVHAKRFIGDWLRLQPLPLQISGGKRKTRKSINGFSWNFPLFSVESGWHENDLSLCQ